MLLSIVVHSVGNFHVTLLLAIFLGENKERAKTLIKQNIPSFFGESTSFCFTEY